jgi:hypothetical protein
MVSCPELRLAQLINHERAYREGTDGSSFNALLGQVHHNVWREMIVQWCYNVVDHIQVDREIVYVAINILDRFLASQASTPISSKTQAYQTDRKDYEAAVMASLLITLKLQGISSLSISDLVKMSRNAVSSKDILRAGEAVVQSLTWNKEVPTAATFARALINILPSSVDAAKKQLLFEECIYSIELSVFDKECSNELPSLLAWAILENAMVSQDLPEDIMRLFHSDVKRVTGLDYSDSLLNLINILQQRSIGESDASIEEQQPLIIGGAAVIPPDYDDEDCNATRKLSNFTLNSRQVFATNVVSMDNIHDHLKQQYAQDIAKETLGKRLCTQKESPLSRTKRYRAF